MKKESNLKILYLLLSVFFCLPSSKILAYDFSFNSNEYVITSKVNKTVNLAKYKFKEIPKTVEYNGITYTVTGIGDEAFKDYAVDYIKLPETIVSIGKKAFYNSNCSVVLPSSIKEIGDSAFANDDMSTLTIYSKITNPDDVSHGKDVYNGKFVPWLYVPEGTEEAYLASKTWNACKISVFINNGGMTYLLKINEELKAKILKFYLGDTNEQPNETLVIPNTITYKNIAYSVSEISIHNMSNLKSLTIEGGDDFISIKNNTKLERIILNVPTSSFDVDECSSLQTIDFNMTPKEIYLGYCEALKSMVFKEKVYDVSLFNGLFINSNITYDVIFTSSNIPPKINNYTIINNNLTLHVPNGAKDAFLESPFKICNIVDDVPAVIDNVEWGYCGNDNYKKSGIGVGNGNNNVEFAMRVPQEQMQAYKGAKITAINFYTSYISPNDNYSENVEYVFIAKRGINKYLVKEPVTTRRGRWMTVKLPKALVIEGEELMVGIGRHSTLSAWWANSTICPDGMWLRVMGDDNNGYKPGVWYQNAGENNWNHPLPITFTIEGNNLPNDIVILNANIVKTEENTNTKNVRKVQEFDKKLINNNINYNAHSIKETENRPILTSYTISPMTNATCDKTAVKVSDRKNLNEVEFTVQNRNKEKVHSFRIIGKELDAILVDTIINRTLMTNQVENIKISIPYFALNTRHHDISFSVIEVNGKADEITCNSDTNIKLSSATDIVYSRKVVIEEGTATWCGWCPRGIVAMKKMEEKYPDNFICIAIHSKDEMQPKEGYLPIYNYFSEYPSCIVNRQEKYIGSGVSDNEWESFIEAEKNNAVAVIKANAYFVSADSSQVRVSTETKFGYDAIDNDVKIAYVVIENEVGPYLQSNYYSSGELEGWNYTDNNVPIIFNNVARNIFEYNGINGSTPIEVVAEKTYSYEHTLALPNNVNNKANIEIVTLLIDGITGEILNADKTAPITDPTSIHNINTNSENILFTVKNRCIETNVPCDSLQIFSVNGKQMSNSNLPTGVYIVKAVKQGHSHIKKCVVK